MKYILLIMPSLVFAAGSGHGSPSDLIPSFVNVFILAALLIWKVGPFAKSHFTAKAEEVDTVMRRAETKAKEAAELMAITSKKMSDSDSEIANLKTSAEGQVKSFQADYEKDVAQRIDRLHEDAKMKIEAEKKSLSDSVNSLLVEKVINKSKETISSNKDLAKGSTQNLLKGL